MPDHVQELIVFPTEAAMRRYQQSRALEQGWVDASGHLTPARLRKLCLPYVRQKGRRMSAAEHLLMRSQVVEVARGHFSGQGTLGALSDSALSAVLDQLLGEMAALPGETTRIVDWMLDHPRSHKLHQLGTLFSVWRAILKQEGCADNLDVNLAIIKLLKGDRAQWPPLLRTAKRITFRNVNWLSPFDETCVAALNERVRVRMESALPHAHAEAAADRLGQRVRAEIMSEPWAMWAEELGDALAVDAPGLLYGDETDRISFSRSAGAYGEIEDLARRICWHLENDRISPDRVALVVPNLSPVQDIIPHVFRRFRIPYFFRRGRPVLSSPAVKAFLSWIAFPLNPERDTLIDLIRNPAIRFARREETVAGLLSQPRRIDLNAVPWFRFPGRCSGNELAAQIEQWMIEPEDHFNAEALNTARAVLEGFGDHSMSLQELIDLLEELLENTTVKPRDSHEQGVWILKADDAVGLDFNVVMFAGLNEGEFPGIPLQDALLSDMERHRLRCHLEEQGRALPVLALPRADVLFEQQSVLFLNVLGMARKQLVLSYQAYDENGNEKSESDYFRKLWNLAGWPAREQVVPSPYDEWRMDRLGGKNILADHLAGQQGIPREDRMPLPGESFLSVVPLPLCRSRDEALQAAVLQERRDPHETAALPQESSLPSVEHLVSMLAIEAERETFLDTPADQRSVSKYCGHVPALREKIAGWFDSREELSPTALERLAECRYVFLMEQVLGLQDERLPDDAPDPMDRGTVIHAILKHIYTAIAEGRSGMDIPRQWAVKTANGWKKRAQGGEDAVPLAVFVPGLEDEYVSFARKIAETKLDQAELGHPVVWAAEREKILVQVLNLVRHDARTCEKEKRYPARFELRFGGDDAVRLGELRLKGIIDRIDLVFSDDSELSKVRVLDYKGSSRARRNTDEYLDDIRRNLDCQLPVYAFAAQQHFFAELNTEYANGKTEAGYLFYERRLSDVISKSKKSVVALDEPGLIDGFLATLCKNIRRLKDGDFSVDPLVASYNDYQSICRTIAVDRRDME